MHAPHDSSRSLFALAHVPTAFADIWTWARHAAGDISKHSGVPVVIVAAMAIVLSMKLARRAVQLLIEVAAVAAILVIATHFGWIRW